MFTKYDEFFFQSSNAWSLLGHLNYLTQKLDKARECYERTLAYIDEPTDIHSVLLRLATIYLKEGQVLLVYNTSDDRLVEICYDFCDLCLCKHCS